MIGALLFLGLARAGPVVVPDDAVDRQRAQDLFQDRRLALLVGPEAFDDDSWTDLRFPDDDVFALGEVLADPEQGSFDQVLALTGSAETRLGVVRAAMDSLAAAVASPDDIVFVYFSTHGTLALGDDGRLGQYLVLSDTRLDEVPTTGLAHDEVLGWLDALPSRRKVLLLATCHSGQGKSRLPPEVEELVASTKGSVVPALREVSEATVVIGVCAWNETARESAELGHDIYTHFFLEALRDGDRNGDGAVTATEAHDHARGRTWTFTEGRQRAYARAEVLGTDPILLTGERSRAGAPVVGSYRSRLDGYRIRVDGQDKGSLPGEIVLDSGRHRVELVEPSAERVVARSRISLREGGRLDAGALLRRDAVRLGGGAAWLGATGDVGSDLVLTGELHLPWLPGRGWELIAHGGVAARWPRPTLTGGVAVERPLNPGPLQVRLGGGLEGFLVNRGGDEPLLFPSLVPVPVLSLAWLPRHPLFARLACSGGYLWTTERGSWWHGAHLRAGLVVGGAI